MQKDDVPLEDEQDYLASLYMSEKEKKIKRVRERLQRKKIRENAFSGTVEVSELFNSHKDI